MFCHERLLSALDRCTILSGHTDSPIFNIKIGISDLKESILYDRPFGLRQQKIYYKIKMIMKNKFKTSEIYILAKLFVKIKFYCLQNHYSISHSNFQSVDIQCDILMPEPILTIKC